MLKAGAQSELAKLMPNHWLIAQIQGEIRRLIPNKNYD